MVFPNNFQSTIALPWTEPDSYGPTTSNGKPWPKISIVTPNYNQGAFIEATFRSVLGQNYPNLEYIVIDGGSTDNSLEVIAKYEKHITYWVSEPDNGQYDAINKGFSRATGEIMAWINSDDMYMPWALRTVAEVMVALPDVNWLTSLYQGFSDVNDNVVGIYNPVGFSRKCFLDGGHLSIGAAARAVIQQESTFWRASLWNRVGGLDGSLKLAGDFDLWAKMFDNDVLHGLNVPLATFRFREGQRASSNGMDYTKEAMASLEHFRIRAGWKRSLLRQLADRLHMHRFGPLSRRMANMVGYRGARIERAEWGKESCHWKSINYSFA